MRDFLMMVFICVILLCTTYFLHLQHVIMIENIIGLRVQMNTIQLNLSQPEKNWEWSQIKNIN